MKIAASQLTYSSAHLSATAVEVVDETITRRISDTPSPSSTNQVQGNLADTVQLSARGATALSDYAELEDLDPKEKLTILVLESLLHRKLRFMNRSSSAAASLSDAAANAAQSTRVAEVHRRTEFRSEMEQTSFQAQGSVATEDGRVIQFSAELNMQREFKSTSVSVGSANMTDPLVVNLKGGPARLTGGKVAFDLDSDGKTENVSFVADGSGFLAVDRNGDGKVNDGSELFGPRTGDGFAELSSYDADGNGWIDEQDPIFTQLRVWTRDGLSTLSENGIAAIATGSVETPFAIKDDANALQANIRATGIYLSESGAAGTIQQVDLAEA